MFHVVTLFWPALLALYVWTVYTCHVLLDKMNCAILACKKGDNVEQR